MSIWETGMDRERELNLQPIGWVVTGRPRGSEGDQWEEQPSEIQVVPAWTEALFGLDEFSHIWIVWWLDGFEEPPTSRLVHPERRAEMPEVGLFATRSPHRPNPVAMTAVRLLGLEKGRLRVRGLDAYEGSPILDIKPYLRRGDMIPEAQMPDWLEDLWRIHDEERDVGTAERRS
jgi:tRNA-Thr(GGU) m(6)t(6)A37 methyltransferase TsaA